MLYALLAYHAEGVVEAMSEAQDVALMAELRQVHIQRAGQLGPAARLGSTELACTLRGAGRGLVIDGPFAETKEHLLGFYVIDCESREAAVEAARDLRGRNPTAVYEIRPIVLYLPGAPFPETDAGLAAVRPGRS
jgi:hypothetical protein